MHANAIFAIVFVCLANQTQSVDYVEDYFDQRVDHFSFDDRTFKQRFIYNDSWWDREGAGPIFFYTGNELAIEIFWRNCAFLLDIAPRFKALVLFAEHRYYGKSLPFGNQSTERRNIVYLSVEQTVADYAVLATRFKKSRNAENSPVVAFGGSYGGLLSASMRIKYPDVVVGAISGSSPINMLSGKIRGDLVYPATTQVFRRISEQCEAQARTAFDQMKMWSLHGQEGLSKMSEIFRLCDSLQSMQDYDNFLRWIRIAFFSLAMFNYPYATPIGHGLPANPADVSCQRLVGARTPVEGLYGAVSVHFNMMDEAPCNDVGKQYAFCSVGTGCLVLPGSTAFDYQGCTEINLEASSNGVQDMFPVLIFNSTMHDEYCKKTWDVVPRRDWMSTFWGEDICSSSNIVFSNGNLDPYYVGGVLNNISDTIVSVIIDGGAHHYDLRGKNPADTPSVRAARAFEILNIEKWLKNASGAADKTSVRHSSQQCRGFEKKPKLNN